MNREPDPHEPVDPDSTDAPDSTDDLSLTDGAVSRLLAEIAEEQPLPPAVRDRLDGVLSGLVAERRDAADGSAAEVPAADVPDSAPHEAREPSNVRPLTARRRAGSRLLLAAAAVGVAGVGIGTLADTGVFGSLSGNDSADTAAAGDAGSAESGAKSLEAPQPGPAAGDSADSGADDGAGRERRDTMLDGLSSPELSSGRLQLDRENLEEQLARGYLLAPGAASSRATREQSAAKAGCIRPVLTPVDSWRVVEYDGQPASLVTRPDGPRHVEARVYDCTWGLFLDGARVRVQSR